MGDMADYYIEQMYNFDEDYWVDEECEIDNKELEKFKENYLKGDFIA